MHAPIKYYIIVRRALRQNSKCITRHGHEQITYHSIKACHVISGEMHGTVPVGAKLVVTKWGGEAGFGGSARSLRPLLYGHTDPKAPPQETSLWFFGGGLLDPYAHIAGASETGPDRQTCLASPFCHHPFASHKLLCETMCNLHVIVTPSVLPID